MADTLELVRVISRPHLRVDIYRQAENPVGLVVTFTERTNQKLEGMGFGGDVLYRLGFDLVAIKSDINDWYQSLSASMVQKIKRAIAASGRSYAVRAAYGSSMGAYAAMRFSRAFDIRTVLALSPLIDITVPWEKRWRADLPAIKKPMFPADCISSECNYFVAFDPLHRDKRHIDEFRKLVPSHRFFPIAVRYSGHPSGPVLNQCGVLRPLLESVMLSNALPERRVLQLQEKGKSQVYLKRLGGYCIRRKKWKWAVALLSKSLLLKPSDASVLHELSRALYGAGDLAGAMEKAQAAVAIAPNHPMFLRQLHLLEDEMASREEKHAVASIRG